MSTKRQLEFVKNLLNQHPDRTFRIYELLNAMPPEILGKRENAVLALRNHLKTIPNVSVWKENHTFHIRMTKEDSIPEDQMSKAIDQQITASTSDDKPYGAPPLYLDWLQLGYLMALLHMDISHKDVIPNIRRMHDQMCEIAKEAYK